MSDQLNQDAERAAPCPFCGGVSIKTWVLPPSPNDKAPDAYCQCEDCTTTGPNGTDATSAIAAWNRRAPSVGGEVELPALPEPDVIAYTCVGDNDAYSPQLVKQIVAKRDERVRVLEAFLEGEASLAKWAQDRTQQPAQTVDTPEFRALLTEYDDEVAYGSFTKARAFLIAYIDGRIARAAPDERVEDLAALVRQLVHSLNKAKPDSDLAKRAVDYLQHKGLAGSPLRAATSPQQGKEGGND